jgi:hypothetical protein
MIIGMERKTQSPGPGPGAQSNAAVVLSGFGKAFWLNSDDSKTSLSETLAAVSLLNLTSERRLEKTSRALLEKGRRNQVVFSHPFFRLVPDERFVLVALHLGRWSYDRVGRILNRTVHDIQEIAWAARLKLLTGEGCYPCGPSQMGPYCPEYDVRRPWVQRFLDEEIESQRDKFFLREHLLVCKPCSQFLARSREAYFKVEKILIHLVSDSELSKFVENILIKTKSTSRFRSDFTFKDSIKAFIKHRDIRWTLYGLAMLLVYYFVHTKS